MKTKLYLSLVFILVSFVNSFAQKVYDTHSEARAKVKVFVVNNESRADLIVYTTNTASRAKGNKGIWFIEHTESRADKKICFVNTESRADLKVYFTNTESRAGWKNSAKKSLMEQDGSKFIKQSLLIANGLTPIEELRSTTEKPFLIIEANLPNRKHLCIK